MCINSADGAILFEKQIEQNIEWIGRGRFPGAFHCDDLVHRHPFVWVVRTYKHSTPVAAYSGVMVVPPWDAVLNIVLQLLTLRRIAESHEQLAAPTLVRPRRNDA